MEDLEQKLMDMKIGDVMTGASVNDRIDRETRYTRTIGGWIYERIIQHSNCASAVFIPLPKEV